jgi:hypothetical protein
MVVDIRRRFRASARSEPNFLSDRFTGRGNDWNDRDRIMFNISYTPAVTVQTIEHYDKAGRVR